MTARTECEEYATLRLKVKTGLTRSAHGRQAAEARKQTSKEWQLVYRGHFAADGHTASNIYAISGSGSDCC
jgi:hypothetical protein